MNSFQQQKSIKKFLLFIFFVLYQLTWGCCVSGFGDDNFYRRPTIYLSVNPKSHQIDLNWFHIPLSSPPSTPESSNYASIDYNYPLDSSTIVYITNTPQNPINSNNISNVLYEYTLNVSDGRQTTPLTYSYTELQLNATCYKFWFHLLQNDERIQHGCMRTNANWMGEMRDVLKYRRFRDLFVPGTHDSASFKTNFNPKNMDNMITRYSLTQDDDIMSQLMHGVRYLDLRVGYYRSSGEKFWANHGISRMHPLSEIFKQVKDFVDATNEIVILDFQEFPVGFRNSFEVHQQFAMFLFQQLGEYAADPKNGWDATLGDIWNGRNRIVIGYDHHAIAQEHGETHIFQSVRQRWGNVKDGYAKLEKFLREQRENMSRGALFDTRPFAEMAELTPQAMDVVTNRLGGLRKMADAVNWHVTRLYHGEFGRRANIVAVDFYSSTNIVEIAIEWNRRRFGADGNRRD